MTSLPADFYTHLSSSKWKDRKELALEPLLNLLSSSLKYDTSSNYTELVTALNGRMTDANVLCVVLAANCLEKLAKGLREEFKGYKTLCTAGLLGRTKEKKQNVLDALGNALDAVYQTVSLSRLFFSRFATSLNTSMFALLDNDRRLYRRRDDVRERQEPIDQTPNSPLLHSLPSLYTGTSPKIRPPTSP